MSRRLALWRMRMSSRIYWQRHRAYTVRVVHDVLDGGFVVDVKEKPGCLSQGDTAPEALRSIADALEAVLSLEQVQP